MDSKYLKTIEMYIFSDKLANVYIRNYVKGDRSKFMVKNGVQFYRGVVLQPYYNCIDVLTHNIECVCIFKQRGDIKRLIYNSPLLG